MIFGEKYFIVSFNFFKRCRVKVNLVVINIKNVIIFFFPFGEPLN